MTNESTYKEMSEESYLMESPLGTLALKANDDGLMEVLFSKETPDSGNVPKLLENPVEQLRAYFSGQRKHFDLALNPQGTDFQKRVWKRLEEIPYGHTASYLDIARQLGDEKATRAVGAANGKNPIAVVVPCHRVVGSDRSLTGYAGGIQNKKWLLELEHGGVQSSLF
ncbi:MAG: methylated-DNA--[protein]-cysteine S-methyltransferase [Salibacteraceae bacterium]